MLWLGTLFLLPLLFILIVSVCTAGSFGEIERPFTLENYQRFFGFGAFGWEPLYPMIIGRTLALAGLTMLLCLLLGLPLAFWIASTLR